VRNQVKSSDLLAIKEPFDRLIGRSQPIHDRELPAEFIPTDKEVLIAALRPSNARHSRAHHNRRRNVPALYSRARRFAIIRYCTEAVKRRFSELRPGDAGRDLEFD
jgi:hypothetical protein